MTVYRDALAGKPTLQGAGTALGGEEVPGERGAPDESGGGPGEPQAQGAFGGLRGRACGDVPAPRGGRLGAGGRGRDGF